MPENTPNTFHYIDLSEINGIIGVILRAARRTMDKSPLDRRAEIRYDLEDRLFYLRRQACRISREDIRIFEDRLRGRDQHGIVDTITRGMCSSMVSEYLMEREGRATVISPKDIYDSLWRCRDFELDHLWQRSLFLSAFLILCFTGYGCVLLKLFDYTNPGECSRLLIVLNAVALVIALLGAIMSSLWIMMGKGSKAWYEKYERAISDIESDPKYSDNTVVQDMSEDGVKHGCLNDPHSVKRCLFNTAAGPYSPSKVNIGIGQVSLFIWAIVILFHSILFFVKVCFKNGSIASFCFPQENTWKIIVAAIAALAIVGFLIWRGIPGFESSTIGIPYEKRGCAHAREKRIKQRRIRLFKKDLKDEEKYNSKRWRRISCLRRQRRLMNRH